MNNDSLLRSSRVLLTAGIVICSVLTFCSLINATRGRQPSIMSLSRGKPAAIAEANRQLSNSYDEFYPHRTLSTHRSPSTPVIRMVSQSEEKPASDASNVSGTSQSQQEILPRNQISEPEIADKLERDKLAQSRSRLSTTTVVEATGNTPCVASEGQADDSSAAPRRTESPAPIAHITVPVTVNVDNGEILTELMRLQEEVMMTREHLADGAEAPKSSSHPNDTESVLITDSSSDPVLSGISNDRTTDAVSSGLKSASRPSETLQPVTPSEASSDAPRPTPAEPVPQMVSGAETVPEFSSAVTTKTDVAASEPEMADEADSELSDFSDFIKPHSGLPDDDSEERLPSFDSPPQAKSSVPSSLNSYAEWVHSFETEEEETGTVTQVVFEEELPTIPAVESNEIPAEPVFAEAVTPLLTIPSELLSDPGDTETSKEQPSTPVPPVPVVASDGFHEPSTIPVFPVPETSARSMVQTPTPTKQVSWTQQAPSANAPKAPSTTGKSTSPSTRKPVSRVATTRSSEAMRSTGKPSSYGPGERSSGPSIASRLKGNASPADTRKPESPGLLARMKSRVSGAVSHVPKPDFDTPMWVDRLADWNDERVAKKNSSETREANPAHAVASQLRKNGGVHAHPHSAEANPASAPRPSSVRRPVSTVPGKIASSDAARSRSQTRANVTTVPRSGQPNSQITRTALATVPQSSQHSQPSAAVRPHESLTASSAWSASQQNVSAASYARDLSQPAQKPIQQTALTGANAPPARLPEMHPPQQHAARTAMILPPRVQQGRDAYYGVPATMEQASVSSLHHGAVTHEAPVAYPIVQAQACDAPTEYVGTLDAFNYRMTMVIRPPSFSNPGSNSVSRWFSNARSAASGSAAPAVHRVSSAIRYSTQPKTVR